MRVRPPAVAGMFYPSDPVALRSFLEQALGEAERRVDGGPVPKALIVPHAGYVYSGAVAASAYARVLPGRERITRIVLLGPAHRLPVAAIAASSAEAFSTPLGSVPVDIELQNALVGAGLAVVRDDAHADEHSLEVQLPFLQVCLGDFAVLPLAVGAVAPVEVAAAVDLVWGGEETLVVVSTDLSHYQDDATAKDLDRRTAAAILARRPDELGVYDACGVRPLQGLLLAAGGHQLDVELLDLRTSADTAGGRDRVVGYGAFALA